MFLVYDSILENEAVECAEIVYTSFLNPSLVQSILLLFVIVRQPPRHHWLRHIPNSSPLHII